MNNLKSFPQKQNANNSCNFQYDNWNQATVAAGIQKLYHVSSHFSHVFYVIIKPCIYLLQIKQYLLSTDRLGATIPFPLLFGLTWWLSQLRWSLRSFNLDFPIAFFCFSTVDQKSCLCNLVFRFSIVQKKNTFWSNRPLSLFFSKNESKVLW